MKTNAMSFSAVGLLAVAVLLFIGILKSQQAYAQVDATSSDIVATSSESTTPTTDGASTSTAPSEDEAPSSTESIPADTAPSAATTPSVSVAPTRTPPHGLTLVHVVGMKYTDYFTDGTTITSYPGDPNIDAHLSDKDAPIPTHQGLTWDHTTSRLSYDTLSGDLEAGQYAISSNGSYIENPTPFVSSTSSAPVSGDSTPSAPTSDTTSTSSTTSGSSTTMDQGASSSPPATDTTATTTP
jgi:hypothetical protein